MARTEPTPGTLAPGRLALAPSADPFRGSAPRQMRRGPGGSPPPRRPNSYGRRRLVALAIVATILVLGYFAVTSIGGGGGGGHATLTGYLGANDKIATQARSIVQAGVDLRTLRDIGVFRRSVEKSVAEIGAQTTTLQGMVAGESASGRSIIRQTIASGRHVASLGADFERQITAGALGPANQDEAGINTEIAALEQQATAWNKR
jgi:hypothetical protein